MGSIERHFNMREKYPCWYGKEAKEIAESSIDRGYCYSKRYECEEEKIEAASYYGWKLYHDSTSIEVCYPGASYGMYFEYEDEAEIEIELSNLFLKQAID